VQRALGSGCASRPVGRRLIDVTPWAVLISPELEFTNAEVLSQYSSET
jgi:hypothetical protein